jgi:uncharacterized repeat protein (TIGR01451 family)
MPTREVEVRKDSQLFMELASVLLRRGHGVQFRVHGQSMQPNLLEGDDVVVVPAFGHELRPGDVALTQSSNGLRVHRVKQIGLYDLTTQGDAGLEADPDALRLFGKVRSRRRGLEEHHLTVWQTRFVHPLRRASRRLRTTTASGLRQFASILTGILGLSILCAAVLVPDVQAQTADLQLTQTASAPAVATTQSLGTATTVTWAGGVASFTFPTPLPSGVVTNALLTTTGFTPAAYNVTNATITSVNNVTGVVTVALPSQVTGTATTATWTGNVASFTFPTPLPSEAAVGAQLTTAGFAPTAYNVTNATITGVNAGTGVVTVALPSQSLGTATSATWAANVGTFFFPFPLPSYAVVGAQLTTIGFTPAGYNVSNAVITNVNAGTGRIRIALANPGAASATAPYGSGTVGPGTSTTNNTGTINPVTSTTNGTGTVPIGYTYSEVVTNKSSSATVTSGTITVYMQTPANTIFESAAGTNWACPSPPAPAAGGVGPIVCTYNSTLASGATATTLTLGFQVVAGTAAGTSIQSSATVTNSTFVDTVPSNNTSISSILVEPINTSDLGVSVTVSPTPVFVSSTLTYSIQVQNYGQASAPATSSVLTDVLPPGATGVTFASIVVPSGWSCTTPPVNSSGTVTCSITSPMPAVPAAGSTSTFAITVNAPTTATTLSNTVSVSLAGDPNAANNSATAYTVVQPLACATPGRDGLGGTLSGIVNTYFPPATAGTLASAATSVKLGAAAAAGAQTAIASGDLLLIIQMQAASINSNNTGSYGDGLPGDPASGSSSLGSSGLFEFVTATSAVPATGGTLNFSGTGPTGGLLNSYSSVAASSAGTTYVPQQTYQVIRVPQYTSATLSSGLVPLTWNGSVGGVLALDVSSQLTLGGTVALDALGFRGGGGRILTGTGTGTLTDYVTVATNPANGSKAEGIAGTPRYVAPATITTVSTAVDAYGGTLTDSLPNGSYARGAPGNAGGGGTDGDPSGNTENSGGGAGGNGGTGGQGGYGWNSLTATNSTDGGFGGVAFPASASALVMGGGGGAGTTNNGTYCNYNSGTGTCTVSGTGTGNYSSGGMGGGIVIVHAGSVAGTGTITANGQSTLSTLNDSTGGGGAGGSILFFTNSGGLGGLTVSANGGNAGDAWPIQTPGGFPGQRHGPGGGGGGGVIFLTALPASSSVAGGFNGYTNTVQDSYGATAGSPGLVASTHVITETPGTQSGAYCGSADVSVTNAGTPSLVAPGGTIVYTQVATNNGPLDAVNAVFSETIPANTTFLSLPAVAGWNCTTPVVGGTGTISCTNPDLAKGASSTFTLTVTVSASAASGSQIVDVDNILSGTNDPNLTNNSATVITTVAASTSSDLQVVNTPSALTTVVGTNVTMTAVVTNNGPAVATGLTFTETLPYNTTVATTFAPPSGWTCNSLPAGTTNPTLPTPPIVLTCTLGSLAVNGTATFPLVLTVNTGTTVGTMISATAQIISTTSDPNTANNVSTATTTVASAGQSDLAVTSSALPNPVTQGNNITYTQTVTNNGPVAATTASFTDTIPAGTTLVSFTPPANWSCNTLPIPPGTGTITCNLNAAQSINVGALVSFPLVVNVNLTTPAGSTVVNTANINEPCSSGGNDPNCNNNFAQTTVYVASPSQSDVSIVKTAAPEPVTNGTNLTYTLAVSNNGPAVAQGVTVSDNIPSTVTYLSSYTPQGTCSTTAISVASPYPSTLQLNCTLGSISVGAEVIITVNVNATTFTSSGPLTVNTATVSSTTSDPDSANNTSSATSTIQASTAVDISSFNAFHQPDGSVMLEWHTLEESRNLGFHLYREDSAGRRRINPSLVVGSALLLRGSRPQHAAKTYRWIDSQPTSDAIYWIEDVDINGTKTLHGPANMQSAEFAPRVAPSSAVASPTLSQLHSGSISAVQQAPRLVTPQPLPPSRPLSAPSFTIADHAAVKISINQEGWYSVPFSQLYAAGLDPNTDPRTLHLFAEGVEQPMLLAGTVSGSGTASGIEFYGTGIDTPFSGTRIYWLVRENTFPKRIPIAPALNSGSAAPASFPFTVIREDRVSYFAALLNGENNDNFFGPVVSSEPVNQVLEVAHIDTTSSQPVALDVSLQGVTDGQQHQVTVQFNGSTIGEVDFFGEIAASQSFPVQPSLLAEGNNTVTLTALDGDNDVSVVKSVQLHYPHTYAADGDWLEATAPAGASLLITGFANPQIRAFDITDPLNITELQGKISSSSGGAYEFAANVPLAGQQRNILAFAADAVSAPATLTPHLPSFLDTEKSGADVVIITHPDFVSNLAPLVNLRESQGHHVQLVTTDQIFDQYNFGERSPFAIRAFLQDAVARWSRKPQSILLVGDASFDPRDYLGLGDFDFVPTRIIETAAFKTASDDWFTDFQQTGYATIPTGRLPVRTTADADLVVSKIVNYEQRVSAGPWNTQALFIADQNMDANFSNAANSAAGNLPAPVTSSRILTNGMPSDAARAQIISALNNGALLVNYSGHGAEQQWSFADLFDTNDAQALINGGRLPVYLVMDCLNGFFQDVYAESLAESLILARNGGAVAVWASSGFTDQGPQATMNQALLRQFVLHPQEPLGRMILDAKSGITDDDVRRTWVLFGDPAMKFQLNAATTPPPPQKPVGIGTPGDPAPVCARGLVCLKGKPQQ